MIPVVVMNNDGELSYQVFNDNLHPVEQINRKLLAAIFLLQTNLTNDWSAVERKIGKGNLTDAQIDELNTSATDILSQANNLVKAFNEMLNENA